MLVLECGQEAQAQKDAQRGANPLPAHDNTGHDATMPLPVRPSISTTVQGDIHIEDGAFRFHCVFGADGRIEMDIKHQLLPPAPSVDDSDPGGQSSSAAAPAPAPDSKQYLHLQGLNAPQPPRLPLDTPPPYTPTSTSTSTSPPPPLPPRPPAPPSPYPRLNIVFLAPGPGAEVLPLLDLAAHLARAHGHAVRFVSHAAFAAGSRARGVAFAGLDGELGAEAALVGQAVRPYERVLARLGVAGGVRRCWEGAVGGDGEKGEGRDRGVADVLVANPLAWGAVHVAERLGVPLVVASRSPWTPTRAFPHPLARVRTSNVSPAETNLLSYSLVDAALWHDISPRINHARTATLGLAPLDSVFSPLLTLQTPTICLSGPPRGARPADWPAHVALVEPSTDMEGAARALHEGVGALALRCPLAPARVASLESRRHRVRLSALAAEVLVENCILEVDDLLPFRSRTYNLPSSPPRLRPGPPDGTSRSVLLTTASRQATPPSARPWTPEAPAPLDPPPRRLGRVLATGVLVPLLVTHALARGFHAVPALYGDATVRGPERVTGFGSGLIAGGKTFAISLFDAISGLVSLPVQGAQREGAIGLLKGFGKGVGGLVFKPAGGACGLPGYAFMGLYKELRQLGSPHIETRIVAARLAQGEEEARGCSDEAKAEIVERWREYRRIEGQSRRVRNVSEGGRGTSG